MQSRENKLKMLCYKCSFMFPPSLCFHFTSLLSISGEQNQLTQLLVTQGYFPCMALLPVSKMVVIKCTLDF